jgi:hypothetical protein
VLDAAAASDACLIAVMSAVAASVKRRKLIMKETLKAGYHILVSSAEPARQ